MADQELELDEAIHARITQLCDVGSSLMEQEKYFEALTEFRKAWELIPDPPNDWHAATWILAAMVDCYLPLGKFDWAKEALQYAMTCPGGLGNPYLHLRFGEALFELGELDDAADELMRAYMSEGRELFEDEDPKYLAFLGTRAKL